MIRINWRPIVGVSLTFWLIYTGGCELPQPRNTAAARDLRGLEMKRGLGSPNYNPERAREVRQMGAKALRDQGKAHRWTPGPEGSASAAGQKGGETRAAKLEQQQEAA